MSATKGEFINFLIDFSKNSNEEQAEIILKKAEQQIKNGAKGVSITYSANYSQTVEIQIVYEQGGWDTHTSGGNQAQVMSAMLSLLGGDYSHLQGKMRIAPITTMPGGTEYAALFSDEKFHLGIVVADLVRIEASLEAGWDVLGWENQVSVGNPKSPYAIGGGIAGRMPVEIDNMIQNTLLGYSAKYK